MNLTRIASPAFFKDFFDVFFSFPKKAGELLFKKFSSNQKRILLVDDEKNILHMMLEVFAPSFHELTGHKFGVIAAANFDAALRAVNIHSFELVVVDVCLRDHSVCDGMDLLCAIRHKNPDAYIVAISERREKKIEEESYANGASLYLEKPYLQFELREKLEKLGIFRDEIDKSFIEREKLMASFRYRES